MSLQDLFMPHETDSEELGNVVEMPKTYRETVSWNPQLGDIAPNFNCQSTHGRISFHSWAEGAWTVLCSYPLRRAGVSESELAGLELAREAFERRDARVLGISPSGLNSNINWIADVGKLFNVTMNTPMVCDEFGEICEVLGVQHENAPVETTIRKTMIFDPALRLRWVAEYPSFLGRSTEELLRVLDGLRMYDAQQLGAPMDWVPGEAAIVSPEMTTQEARRKFGDAVKELTPKIRTVVPPSR